MSNKTQEILKRVAGLSFGLAFLMALVLFGNVGRQYISLTTAKIIFMAAGAIGLVLNLLTFQSGKNSPLFNFLYWIGSIVLFVGLVFLQMRFPYGFYIIVAGLIILGLSFVLPTSILEKEEKREDVLDDLN